MKHMPLTTRPGLSSSDNQLVIKNEESIKNPGNVIFLAHFSVHCNIYKGEHFVSFNKENQHIIAGILEYPNS